MKKRKAPGKPRPKQVPRSAVGDARVLEIIGLMSTMSWSASSPQELAAKWGVTPASVRRLSAEASRHIKMFVAEEGAVIRERVLTALNAAVAKGLADPKGLSAAVRALGEIAKIHGLHAPVEQSVTHRIDSMSEEELDAYEKKLVKELRESKS